MTEAQEKKNRKIAMATSMGVHGVILLLLLFMVAWRAPNPPLAEYGIELNFGTATQGSGDIQPEAPVGVSESQPEEVEETVEELPEPEPVEITEDQVEEEAAAEETEPVQQEVTSKIESPVVVEEKKEVKPVEKPAEKVVEKKPEVKPVPEKPLQVYKQKTETTTDAKADRPTGTPGNQGNDVNKPGDKGDPQGTLDKDALYDGKRGGGGGGGGVSLTGFGGFGHPDIVTPPLPDESFGIYEFKVKVDEQGYVISVTPVQRGLSFEAERRLKATIQKLQFIPRGNTRPAEGTITFRVTDR